MYIYIHTIHTYRRANGIYKYIYIHNSYKNYLIFIYIKYIYMRANGIYISQKVAIRSLWTVCPCFSQE